MHGERTWCRQGGRSKDGGVLQERDDRQGQRRGRALGLEPPLKAVHLCISKDPNGSNHNFGKLSRVQCKRADSEFLNFILIGL